MLKLGYHVYNIDHSKGSGSIEFGFDAQLRGPWLGATFSF